MSFCTKSRASTGEPGEGWFKSLGRDLVFTNSRDRDPNICEHVARIEKCLPGNDLTSTGQLADNLQHHIRVPHE